MLLSCIFDLCWLTSILWVCNINAMNVWQSCVFVLFEMVCLVFVLYLITNRWRGTNCKNVESWNSFSFLTGVWIRMHRPKYGFSKKIWQWRREWPKGQELGAAEWGGLKHNFLTPLLTNGVLGMALSLIFQDLRCIKLCFAGSTSVYSVTSKAQLLSTLGVSCLKPQKDQKWLVVFDVLFSFKF